MHKKYYYISGLTILYFLLSLASIFNHEIWLDEAHHWLLARDSTSLSDLFFNLRYEGHPFLWNILLYYISRFTDNPFWMQFLHIIISTLAIFVFLKNAPFKLIFKTLFIFGYYMFFEYNTISRNYMLGIIFIFLALSIYEKRHKKFLLFTFLLALSANVHLIFLIISSILYAFVVFEKVEKKTIFHKKNSTCYLLFGFGLILSAIQIIPPSDSVFFDQINSLSYFERSIKGFIGLWKGIITIPDFRTIHFWNSNIFINLSKPISAILVLFTYILPVFIFNKNKRILYFVYTAIFGAQVFFFVTQRGNARSEGIFFLIFIIALWLEKHYTPNPINRLTFSKKTKQIFIYSILCVHFLSGIIAYSIDIKQPFTPAKNVAELIKINGFDNQKIIVDFCDAPLSSYLETKVYSLCNNELKSYCNWDNKCYSEDERKLNLISLLKNSNESYVYITLKQINRIKNIEIKLLKKVNQSILLNRGFHVYQIKYQEDAHKD